MRAIHISHDLRYRSPFGAQPCDSYVDLYLDIESGEDVDFILLNYAYGLKEFTEGRIMMQLTEEGGSPSPDRYMVRLRTPGLRCLVFYWFEIRMKDKSVIYFTKDIRHANGGRLSTVPPRYQTNVDHIPAPYQITVYEKGFAVPEWYAGKIMYQIFPDRFKRGSDFDLDKMKNSHPSPLRIYHEKWDEEIDIAGKPPEGYKALDFYGGTLNGIREELPYIKSLGTSIIYLNPIFEARSNHRYDTADYMNVDPILGTNEDFERLCEEASQLGMRILLDGVFSHTGADSIYFNKYGHYPSHGAFQSLLEKNYSPFFNWYNLHQDHESITYDSWWGFEDLPAVKENDLTFREFILGPEGVIRTWMRRGAAGFRLDVSDELPDSFIEELRRAVKAERADGVVLGEVWEDASHKISYGAYRDFLLGVTHDNVMGYPFRQAVIDFLTQRIAADEFAAQLIEIRENYPPAAYMSSMNLLSSHDTTRFITAAAGDPDPGSRELQMRLKLNPNQRRHGEQLLALATFLQMVFPGNPSIYYGDEIGMEGYRDPFNRRTFVWEKADINLKNKLAELAKLRLDMPVLQTGFIEPVSTSGRLLVFRRYLDEEGKDMTGSRQEGPHRVVVAINAGDEQLHIVTPKGEAFELAPWSGSLEIGHVLTRYV